jgi:signal transduction histidine kinase
MAHGDYTAHVTVQQQDEVGRLSSSFNEMAEEVSASHARLAGQVMEAQRLAEELNQAREVAVSASKAKSNFLATMSHEIRTPINAIIGYTDILDLGIPGPINPEQRENLGRIRASSSHLLALINDVLDLSRIESGTMQLRSSPINTRPSIDAAVSLVEPVATTKGIRLVVETDDVRAATYMGDERGVRQALANLLSNAVKFTNRGGEVRVACSLSKPPAGAELNHNSAYVAIRVSDTGIGIDNEKIGRLFQPFTQLEAENGNPYTRQKSGAGLGLSISRHLARMMGGDITVESSPRHGSAFTLWLPQQSSDAIDRSATPGTSGKPTSALASHTIELAIPD